MNSELNVPNLDRALTIIEHLNEQLRPVSLSDIARELEFPQNSVYRIMMTLLQRGYVERDAKTKRFVLSKKFLTIRKLIYRFGQIGISIALFRDHSSNKR